MPLTAGEERDFERRHISSVRARYLATDVVRRVNEDDGYREKLELIERSLRPTSGWLLDIGANTCGESEVLSHVGRQVIALDVNEVALALSQQRVASFGHETPSYVAGDAHRIPLANESIHQVLCFETLHHLEHPDQGLREIARVLVPGGQAFFFEPYAYNPYRRLSEVRDRIKGSIEKSFAEKRLRRLVVTAGLGVANIDRVVLPPSAWKKAHLSARRAQLKDWYYSVARRLPGMFGSLAMTVSKLGQITDTEFRDFEAILRCPVTKTKISRVPHGLINESDSRPLLYPIHEGIPVLIAEDATELSRDEWRRLRSDRDSLPPG